MIVYHGTTCKNAQSIAQVGFRPWPPWRQKKIRMLGAIWFTTDKRMASRIAQDRARLSDEPAVLTCDLDVPQLRRLLGHRNVKIKEEIVIVRGLLAPPTEVKVGSHKHMAQLVNFLEACCVEMPEARARASALYSAYQCWCSAEKETSIGQRAFFKRFKRCGFQRGIWGGEHCWFGIHLITDQSVSSSLAPRALKRLDKADQYIRIRSIKIGESEL